MYEKEMLAILEAIRCWRTYLLGRKFTIITDQRSLKFLLEQRITTPEQQKRITKLVGFNYEILYCPGRENSAADALSRRVTSDGLNTLPISSPSLDIWVEIVAGTRLDSELGPILEKLEQGEPNEAQLRARNGCITDKGRVRVPAVE